MKKSVKKTLSAVLALVLILSALPMAAFAAEEVGVAPASIICKDGEHIYRNTYCEYTNCGTNHHVVATDTCVICGSIYRHEYDEDHLINEKLIATDPDNGFEIYRCTCDFCDYVRYETREPLAQ